MPLSTRMFASFVPPIYRDFRRPNGRLVQPRGPRLDDSATRRAATLRTASAATVNSRIKCNTRFRKMGRSGTLTNLPPRRDRP